MINNGKAKIEKTFDGLNIIVPSKKNWFSLLFGTVWFFGWLFGVLMVSGILLSSSETSDLGEADMFLTFWLIVWTFGGLVIVFLLLWGYFGQEKFITKRNEVLFEKTVFNIGKKNRLDISGIKNFRTEFVNNNNNLFGRNNWALWGLGVGKIKFDYGLKTYSFGLSVDEAEANYIVGLFKEQFKEQ